jgi:excisionase family DNA binding protein
VRVALSVEEAAAALGVSRDHFERHVLGALRVIYSGRRRLILVRELERWARTGGRVDTLTAAMTASASRAVGCSGAHERTDWDVMGSQLDELGVPNVRR